MSGFTGTKTMDYLSKRLNQQGVKASRAKRPVINSLKNDSPYFNTARINKTAEREEAQMNMNANVQTQAVMEDFNFGQMRHFTTHFNFVMTTFPPGPRRDKMLSKMMTQLEECFGIPWFNNETFNAKYPFLIKMYRAISEARAL